MDPDTIGALMGGGPLDRETIENLRKADLEEVRKVLSDWLPADEVEGIIRRIRALLAAQG